MSRTLSTNNATETALAVTRPMWLLTIEFSTVLRLASRGEDITYESNTYTGANFTVDLNRPLPSVTLYNDQLAYGDDFLSEGPGTPATLLKLYGDEPFSTGDADEWWTGFIGEGSVDQWIQFVIRPNVPTTVPRFRAVWELGFNHVPPAGSEIQTNAGTFIIQRND